MNGVYGGLIIILIYSAAEGAVEQEFALITQNNIFIQAQTSQNILVTE